MGLLLRDVWARRELLWLLCLRNLKIRYKGTVLGFFWSLLGPVFMIVVYAVFARILRFNTGSPHYLQFLIVGLIAWQFVQMCLGDSLQVVAGNANLIKKTAFPRVILPLAMGAANLVNFLLMLVVVAAFLFASGLSVSAPTALPLVLATHAALCVGAGLLVACANVFFRDTQHLLQVVTLAWFFLTPIFYPLDMQLSILPESLRWVAFANPMTGLVCAYRGILMSEPPPSPTGLALSFGVCWVVLLLGLAVFRRVEPRFGDEL